MFLESYGLQMWKCGVVELCKCANVKSWGLQMWKYGNVEILNFQFAFGCVLKACNNNETHPFTICEAWLSGEGYHICKVEALRGKNK